MKDHPGASGPGPAGGAPTRVGVAATPAEWSVALRNYVRDHARGLVLETLLEPRQLNRRAEARFDVLVVDDVSRIFGRAAIEAAARSGVFVLGLFDQPGGLGPEHLEKLGVQLVLPASTPVEELAAMLGRIRPAPAVAVEPPAFRDLDAAGPVGPGRPARVSVWCGVTGGCGLTEAVVAVAEALARRQRVVVIEAEPNRATLAARLSRSPEAGLTWAFSRISAGLPALPGARSGPRADGAPSLGSFDLIAQAPFSAGSLSVPPGLLAALVEEASGCYDHVLVAGAASQVSALMAAEDPSRAGGGLLSQAEVIVAGAGADPVGVVELCNWHAAVQASGVTARRWAFLGRARRSRYEQTHLADLLLASTPGCAFERLWLLPEDEQVARARWNAVLVTRGRWQGATETLASTLLALPEREVGEPTEVMTGWGMVLSP